MNHIKSFETGPFQRITVHCGDCIAGMKQMTPGSVSVIVTSPPYNLGIKYSSYNDSITRKDYLEWMDSWAQAVAQVMEPEGSLFLNIGSAPSDPFIAMDVARQIAQHLTLQNTIHWIKAISIDNPASIYKGIQSEPVSYGHFKPINSTRFINDCHEYIFHFTHTGRLSIDRKAIGVPYMHKSNITRWKSTGRDVRCRGNTWFIPYKTITSRKKDRPHPASYPEELVEKCIRLHGYESIRMVMDPFLGIGTTALVCAHLNLNFIGYEIDPLYYTETINRLEHQLSMTGLQPTLFGETDSEIPDLRTRKT
ncbi:site-specific DNA-methyltransferase [bacterium]|nr:site-specific DNA-methyltransferase [candidate division CSSED10-310 bacterium]